MPVNDEATTRRTNRLLSVCALLPADADRTEALAEDHWVCRCGNEPHLPGFVPVGRDGCQVAPTFAQWPEPLDLCNGCGLVMDGSTTTSTAHAVEVVGKVGE